MAVSLAPADIQGEQLEAGSESEWRKGPNLLQLRDGFVGVNDVNPSRSRCFADDVSQPIGGVKTLYL